MCVRVRACACAVRASSCKIIMRVGCVCVVGVWEGGYVELLLEFLAGDPCSLHFISSFFFLRSMSFLGHFSFTSSLVSLCLVP